MPDDFHSIQELFNVHEGIFPGGVAPEGPPTRSLSLRIQTAAYVQLEELADRWGLSKSGLGARILEAALTEMELLDSAAHVREAKAAEGTE